jgi:hypothetical protein
LLPSLSFSDCVCAPPTFVGEIEGHSTHTHMAEHMATEKEKEAFVGRSGSTSSPRVHSLCQKRLNHATSKSSYVRYMLEAMKKAGW